MKMNDWSTGMEDVYKKNPSRHGSGTDALALLLPGGAALTGLRVHRRLRAGSPEKAR
ncbi:hypothetical protein AAFL31_21465 [Klebsiella huaxiensis]|uniref:hypothetical protein n=1 Tax=Klebsiella huaxiensis TaxID=2153354 RepID=UPI003160B1E7